MKNVEPSDDAKVSDNELEDMVCDFLLFSLPLKSCHTLTLTRLYTRNILHPFSFTTCHTLTLTRLYTRNILHPF